jgi:hypothetical protein
MFTAKADGTVGWDQNFAQCIVFIDLFQIKLRICITIGITICSTFSVLLAATGRNGDALHEALSSAEMRFTETMDQRQGYQSHHSLLCDDSRKRHV